MEPIPWLLILDEMTFMVFKEQHWVEVWISERNLYGIDNWSDGGVRVEGIGVKVRSRETRQV